MNDWPEGVNQEDVYDIIDAVTASLHRKYKQWVAPDDVRQELRLYAWKKRAKFATYLVREDEGRRRAGEAAFMKSLSRYGDKHCRKEKAHLCGYEPEDEYFYTAPLIEALIAAHLQGQQTLQGQVAERKPVTDPAEGGNLMTMMIDVIGALARIEPEQRLLLVQLHGENLTHKQVADRAQVTVQAVHQREERAIRAIQRILGSEWGDPPGRE